MCFTQFLWCLFLSLVRVQRVHQIPSLVPGHALAQDSQSAVFSHREEQVRQILLLPCLMIREVQRESLGFYILFFCFYCRRTKSQVFLEFIDPTELFWSCETKDILWIKVWDSWYLVSDAILGFSMNFTDDSFEYLADSNHDGGLISLQFCSLFCSNTIDC